MPYYLKQPIHIAEYDPQWPVLYAQEKQCIEAALGSVILAIEHIGSTAIPGLVAKPIVDILVGVGSLEDVSAFVPGLRSLGYEDAQINPKFQRRMFCKGEYNEGAHHLHIVIYGSDPWRQPLRFRDYLRTHEHERRSYGELKKQLAQQYGQNLDGYSEGKGPFVEAILASAAEDAL